jgi:hypothetical protein
VEPTTEQDNAEALHYEEFGIEPQFRVSVLYSGSQIRSFDIYYFSNVLTKANGVLRNFAERDGHYGTSRFTDEHLLNRFMLDYIRKRVDTLPAEISAYIHIELDEYVERHADQYADA